MKIEKLFFVSSNKMLSQTLDLLSKQRKLHFFTIDKIEESHHFITDLQPQVILLDVDDLTREDVNSFYEKYNTQIPVVCLVGEVGQGCGHEIVKPINPTSLIDKISTIIG